MYFDDSLLLQTLAECTDLSCFKMSDNINSNVEDENEQKEMRNRHLKFLDQLKRIQTSHSQSMQETQEKLVTKQAMTDMQFVQSLAETSNNFTIDDSIIKYNLNKRGCECPDLRVRRLIGIAVKHFIVDILSSAEDHKQHFINGLQARKRNSYLKNNSQGNVCEMRFLKQSLRDRGIEVHKPLFHISPSNN